MTEDSSQQQYGKADWEEVRLRFFNSLLADTSINNLLQNLEGGETWPLEGPEEVPSKYIDYSWEELQELPGLAGHPERLDLLIGTLKETAAFDDPFGDMVTTVETATDQDNSLERNLEDLKIPADCPLRFGALSESTLSFCEGEGVNTVGDFASFSERMAQSVLVGGDFQAALNALVTKDEYAIARYLPYRPHEKGFHLIEAIGLFLGQLREGQKCSLLKRYGNKRPAVSEKATLDRKQVAELEEKLEKEVRERVQYFESEAKEMAARIEEGVSLERCFVVLNNEEFELIGSALLERVLKADMKADMKADDKTEESTSEAPPRRRGFFARLFGRG